MTDTQSSPGASRGFRLRVRIVDGFDAGRDICRLHPETMQALGMRIWDPVHLQGTAETAGLCGHADWNTSHDICTIDSLTAENAGVHAGGEIILTPMPIRPASKIWLEPLGNVAQAELPPDALRAALLGKAVIVGERESLLPQDFNRPFTDEAGDSLALIRRVLGPQWQRVRVGVTRTEPEGVVMISAQTQIHWGGAVGQSTGGSTQVTLADLAGLDTEIAELREVIELPILHADLLADLGVSGPHGALVHGPPGSGKRALVYAVADAVGAQVHYLNGMDLEYLTAQKAAEAIKRQFGEVSSEPTVILIEDIDRIAPADRESRGGASVALIKAIDGVSDLANAVAIATTSSPEACDPALFEAGRLDRRIEIPLPDRTAREEILNLRTRALPLAPDVDLTDLAARTPGFVGADIGRLCEQAALEAAARIKGQLESARAMAQVTGADFNIALKQVRPSALGAKPVETGDVTWDDVGDAEETKKALTETVLWPIRYPETFNRLGMEPPGGVLLYGPPGCGKTFVVAALANAAESNLIAVKGAELLSKWVGESEAGVRELFRRARAAAPAIVFLDEIDALAPVRGASTDSGVTDRVVAQMLTELDGIEPLRGVAVVGATNRPDLIDPALLRPGRLERHIFVEPPDAAARAEIFRAATRKMPVAPGIDLDSIAYAAQGYSAADLAAVGREAGFAALHRDPAAVSIEGADFQTALAQVRPSVNAETVERLRRFAEL